MATAMHPDLPHEQAYFDRALALRDRQQADLARAPRLAANPKAAVELRKRVSKLGLADPDEAIAFGRIEAADSRWYIGKGAIWDDDNELVVVNWQAPIAAPFYTATPDDPAGLDARRLFRCSGNQIREIEDLVFRDLADAIADGREPEPVLTDALLDALGSARSGELGDIVATIQAAQYGVISRDIDQLLVVQGGPGTGKTVVGLHRVSWLLFNRRDRLEANDVLIVGPNPAFVHYISSVLPSLGDVAVLQLPLRALGPQVRVGRVDPPALARLKGDRRLLRLILRGLRQRQRIDASDVELTVEGRQVTLDGRRIATRARQLAGRPHNAAHRMLRAFVLAEVRAVLARGRARETSPADVTLQASSTREIDNYLSRVWPNLTPQRFLVELLSSRRQLLAAGAGTLTEAELGMLALPADAQVSTWQWSVDDVPLLDAADALMNGVRATYEHIVVDEAQDLSPLQLESIRRRSRTGSMTVLGDLAQGTSPWAHDSWDEVIQILRHERVTVEPVELEYGYRLPAEVHEVAMRLLPAAAPGLGSPRAVRSSGHEVAVVDAGEGGDVVAGTLAALRDLLGQGIVGVVAPASTRTTLTSALDEAGIAWTPELRPAAAPVVVLGPDDAKGLEFDIVVVVEPAAIVAESEHGLRALYVALTRCTSRLALVHTRPLPAVLGLGRAEAPPATEEAEAWPADVDDVYDVFDVEAVHDVDAVYDVCDVEAVQEVEVVHDVEAVYDAVQEVEAVQDVEALYDAVHDVEVAEAAVATGVDPEGDAMADPGDQPEDGLEAEAEVDGDGDGDAVADRAVAAGVDARAEALNGRDGRAAWAALAAEGALDAMAGDDDAGDAPVAGAVLDPGSGAPGSPFAGVGGTGDAEPVDEPEPVPHGLAERVVVSTPASDLAGALDALGDLDRDIARAVAAAVADKLGQVVAPALLPLVAAELVRRLERDGIAVPGRDAAW
ncbi:MAG TPA: ATP-binding domain-containing protein [Acidimicrobiales bacterium]|nr:ATP-binding domain-containing protein [Acidimicrobiales bacterium]